MTIVESQVMPASIYPMELLAEMYQLENPDQKATRLKRLAEYDASKHISEWQKFDKQQSKNVTIRYYPASWRLFELHLRYPYANFSSDIYLVDREADIVVVKCLLYLGPSYELSPKKAEAYKQGRLSMLDKIETAAKARCARDFGIGTEHALDIEDAEIGDYVPGEEPRQPQQQSNRQQTNKRADQPRQNNKQQAPSAQQQQATKLPEPAANAQQKQDEVKTPGQIRKELQEAELIDKLTERLVDFNRLLEIAFEPEIEQKRYTLEKLQKVGDELPPTFCKRLTVTLHRLIDEQAA